MLYIKTNHTDINKVLKYCIKIFHILHLKKTFCHIIELIPTYKTRIQFNDSSLNITITLSNNSNNHALVYMGIDLIDLHNS